MNRILILSHGHPSLSIGGGENAAYAIHKQMRGHPDWQSWFLAAAPAGKIPEGKDLMELPDKQEFLVRSSTDSFLCSSECNLSGNSEVKSLVSRIQPDVIHVNHFINLGFDLLYAMRMWCPKALFLYTFHEFLLQCPLNGQLLTSNQELCSSNSLQACQKCLPYVTIDDLTLRRELVYNLVANIDYFIAPSKQLKKIFVTWGIKDNRIRIIDYILPEDIIKKGDIARSKNVPQWFFGFFGNCVPSKGLDLLLEAMVILVQKLPIATLIVNGPINNKTKKESAEHKYWKRVHTLLDHLGSNVIVNGPYHQPDVSNLMSKVGWVVMASRWFENSPVVIQEARACGRPLIVPAMGGMAEKVKNGVDGIHYEPNSVISLVASLERCCVDHDLFTSLKKSIRKPPIAQAIIEHETAFTTPKK